MLPHELIREKSITEISAGSKGIAAMIPSSFTYTNFASRTDGREKSFSGMMAGLMGIATPKGKVSEFPGQGSLSSVLRFF